MKIQKIFWALMVMALPLSFMACGDKDSDEDDDTPYNFQPAPQKADAAAYTVSGTSNKTRSVVFGEGGNCAIGQVKSLTPKFPATRGGGEDIQDIIDDVDPVLVYIIGTYVKNGSTYTITVNGKTWGTITILNENGKVYLVIKEVNQKEEKAEAQRTPEMAANTMNDLLCRTWTPFRTRLNFKKTSSETWIADELVGADFEAVKARVEKEGCDIKDDFGNGYTVSSIFFTQTGTFCIAFTNGKSYVGKWWWTNVDSGDLRYEWEDEDNMGCEYESGTAHVDIYSVDVYKGECWLRLTNTIKNGDTNWDFQLVFRLRP